MLFVPPSFSCRIIIDVLLLGVARTGRDHCSMGIMLWSLHWGLRMRLKREKVTRKLIYDLYR